VTSCRLNPPDDRHEGVLCEDECVLLVHVTNPHCRLCFLLPLSIDVTEVQIFIIIMYLLAAVGGSAFWQSLVIVIGSTSYRFEINDN